MLTGWPSDEAPDPPTVKTFVYELATGGGLPLCRRPVLDSLLREGAAMLAAVATDFRALHAMEVLVMRDAQLATWSLPGCSVHDVTDGRQEEVTYRHLAAQADWTVVIAPEFDGLLSDRARWVEESGGRLLGPGPELIDLAADKERTVRALRAAGVPAADGQVLAPGQPLPVRFPYPAVVKPIDGAGSVDTRLARGPHDRLAPSAKRRRLERFYPGIAASVAVLCGPTGRTPLAACRQTLSRDGHFRYCGGTVPLARPLAKRAVALALRATEALPRPFGYIGVDLVLGDPADGSGDIAIEINPRLTTSYTGLRAATDANLASAMLTIASGGSAVPRFRPEPRDFTVAGIA